MHSPLKAIRFLYSSRPEAGSADGPADWLHWIVPLGMASGIVLAVIVGLGWGLLTNRYGDLWMATVPALLLYWLGPGGARYAGLGRTWASIRLGFRLNDIPHDSYPGIEGVSVTALAVVAAAISQFVGMAMLRIASANVIWQLPSGLRFVHDLVFPWTHYGAIVLMGLWGNAAVLLASCLGRPAGYAGPETRQLLASRLLPRLAWGLLAPAAVSMVFIIGWRWQYNAWETTVAAAAFHALATAAIMFGVTMLFAWLLARRAQGHCRSTLLGAGLLGEITFLIIFHAMYK